MMQATGYINDEKSNQLTNKHVVAINPHTRVIFVVRITFFTHIHLARKKQTGFGLQNLR